MWEIASRSSRPFEGIQEVVIPTMIKDGKRPEIPNDCPIEIKNLIEQCWNQEAKQRPTMPKIIEILEKLNAENFKVNDSVQFGDKYPSHSYPNLEAQQNQRQNQNHSSSISISRTALLKQKMLYYLSNELKIEQEDINDVIDVFVKEKITVKQLEEAERDELKELFSNFKIASGVQMRIVKAIVQTKSKV